MSKIAIEDVQAALEETKVEPETQEKVLEQLKKVIEEEKEHRAHNKGAKTKTEFGVILYDANGELKGKEFTASIYSVKEGFDHGTVLTKISEASRAQNEAKSKAKRKSKGKTAIETIGEAFSALKRKFIKEKEVNLKTKEPVRVTITDNKLI